MLGRGKHSIIVAFSIFWSLLINNPPLCVRNNALGKAEGGKEQGPLVYEGLPSFHATYDQEGKA